MSEFVANFHAVPVEFLAIKCQTETKGYTYTRKKLSLFSENILSENLKLYRFYVNLMLSFNWFKKLQTVIEASVRELPQCCH